MIICTRVWALDNLDVEVVAMVYSEATVAINNTVKVFANSRQAVDSFDIFGGTFNVTFFELQQIIHNAGAKNCLFNARGEIISPITALDYTSRSWFIC